MGEERDALLVIESSSFGINDTVTYVSKPGETHKEFVTKAVKIFEYDVENSSAEILESHWEDDAETGFIRYTDGTRVDYRIGSPVVL